MHAFRRYLFPLFAVAIFLLTGYCIWTVPAHEIACSQSELPRICTDESCIRIITLQIGNTGSETAEWIRISIPEEWRSHSLMPPSLRRFGKLPMEFEWEGPDKIRFGPLESEKWISFNLTLRVDHNLIYTAPNCSTIVMTGEGRVVRGSPEFIRFGRFVYRGFSIF